MESHEQEMARKSMAAAAVSVASLLSDNRKLSILANTSQCAENAIIQSSNTKNDITKAATWLTWAETLLSLDEIPVRVWFMQVEDEHILQHMK